MLFGAVGVTSRTTFSARGDGTHILRRDETAETGQRRAGVAMMLTSSASNQSGAALGAMAFPVIGPVRVVAIRQLITAVVLTPLARPRIRGLRADQWWPILGLVAVFSIMNLSLYAAIDRIGLGLAVTLEFLGSVTVAIAASRRAVDIGCAVLAGLGVVVLTNPGPTTDFVGGESASETSFFAVQARFSLILSVLDPRTSLLLPELRTAGDATQVRLRVPPRREARHIAELMQSGIALHWTLDALASEAHLSPPQLHRVFKQSYGTTPREHLTRLRGSNAP